MLRDFFDLYILKILSPVLGPVWQIIRAWWWLVLPFLLAKPFKFIWKWWRMERWLSKRKSILLEIKIPKEVLKPIRAMETVMSGLFQTLYQPPDWWEKWIDGQIQLSYSFEIASFGGETHFFIRIPDSARDSIESLIYSQYPDAEISLAEDYTNSVPHDIPNKNWDLWASDYRLLKPNAYPIKTYPEFETEREALEEKRIDPMAGLLEAMAKIKPGEQLWVQMIAKPITNEEVPWVTEGQKLRDVLARREKKAVPQKPMIMEAADILITGQPTVAKKEEEGVIPPEMKLTPGERDVLSAVEGKISKPAFQATIRFVYLGKKDVFQKANLRLAFGYFASFLTFNLNGLVPWGKTMTKIHKSWFLPLNLIYNRRLYLRKRNLFRNYAMRVTPLFPRHGGTFILNVEEMASLFHFPGRGTAPAPFMPRIEAKRGEAPPGLPME